MVYLCAGRVLYEMTTGKRAFKGKTTASVIAAVLAAEPQPISVIQPMSPPTLDRVVKTCIAKDPDERFQNVHDVKTATEVDCGRRIAGRRANSGRCAAKDSRPDCVDCCCG
jgi:serine/threonine protein kinase